MLDLMLTSSYIQTMGGMIKEPALVGRLKHRFLKARVEMLVFCSWKKKILANTSLAVISLPKSLPEGRVYGTQMLD